MLHEPIKHVQIFDGAAGTELSGLPEAKGRFIEELNLLHPELVENLHARYIESGADYLTTNTFGVNPIKWNVAGSDWKEVADAAIAIARRAAGNTGTKVMFDIGPSGKLMEPIGDFTFEQAYDNIRQVVEYTKDKVDGYIIETYSDLYEAKAAVLAAKECSDLPVFATMTFDATERTLTGSTPEIVALTLTSLNVDAVGINCSTSPEHFYDLVKRMRPFTHLPILVQPNKGLPIMAGGKVFYNFTDEQFAQWTGKLIEAGASIVGGCCGTSPSTIRAISAYKGRELPEYAQPDGTYICSPTRLLKLEKGIICGERLNPTGKKKLQQALLSHDFDYLQREALNQEEGGAAFLDLNVGIPNCNEKELISKAVKKVQEVCDLPLQIDSANAEALEAGIRLYNGVPMINSINGSDESLDALLPVMKKYGTPAVSLVLNKKGIPDTVEGRMDIARHIIERAEAAGIARKQLVFDALVMTISSNSEHGNITLETLSELKKLGVLTIVGLSNISFGLPQRAYLNRTFLAMALTKGLDIPIMNPLDRDTVETVKAFNALSGADNKCEEYIAFNAETQQETAEKDLYHAVTSGLKDAVESHLQEELAKRPADSIINEVLIPALNEVGEKFANRQLFLPQLIQSAEAAKQAFDRLAGMISRNESEQKAAVILATVKGDIHDIGKNIVKVVLESHGYRVIDLGKNVDEETIAEAYRQHRPAAIGLSALMTTTVDSMELCISHLRNSGIHCPVIVGGAVITENIAHNIGADHYAKDALSAVDVMEKITAGTN